MKQQKSFSQQTKGCLYQVPTPIGNLEDMTLRAINRLKEADLIASEDTRVTQKLLNHFAITTPQISFHAHNYQERLPQLLARLQQGETIAQVSDAGMPSISDPGFELTQACLKADIPVIALPGASAGITALVASGLPPQPFAFQGFLPRKRNEMIKTLQAFEAGPALTLIVYESPYRLAATTSILAEVLGAERQIVLARELTKIHEEYLRGTLADLLSWLTEHELKGECCLLIGPPDHANQQTAAEIERASLTIEEHVKTLMATAGLAEKAAIKQAAKERGIKKQIVYQHYHLAKQGNSLELEAD